MENRGMIKTFKSSTLPRLPLEGSIDFTYRCNNHCLHCWLWSTKDEALKKGELTFDEICSIVTDARKVGCRKWSISGGEPLLRPDFYELFEFITGKSTGYTINTNGTLITPKIARLLKLKGTKMVAIYGATAEVYDSITRNPGGFDMLMQGTSYLKEAGTGFIVQLIPMKANWHQWDDMVKLAESLSLHWRVGAPWLYLSCDGSPERNKEIAGQRLSPADVIELDKPNPSYGERMADLNAKEESCGQVAPADDRLFAKCIASRRDFHIDAYGQMSWCSFIKDPSLRYDLCSGSFEEAWEKFIPSCADKVRGGKEWLDNCGSCEKKSDCRWCAVYSYLEKGRYSAPISYLCKVADESAAFKDNWIKKHLRYFRIAGITVRIESDLDFETVDFKQELLTFAVDGPGDDNVTFRHYFNMPDLSGKDLGEELYRKPPWAISRKSGIWYYLGISPNLEDDELHRVAVFSPDHCHATIYSPKKTADQILENGWHSLSLFPTDQIWLGPILAERQAVLIHSAAAVLNGKGLVFVGHSDAGKSTTMELLKTGRSQNGLRAEVLCDDRNIIRKWDDGWKVHGTWSHGTTADVSAGTAPLCAILFLEQSKENCIVPVTDRKVIWKCLLATLIRAAVTADWWQKELDILEKIVAEVPCYIMKFDKTGAILPELERLAR
jgi:MoaA/NifB/PqqE/SkfB family radical SAM enzyme